MGRVHQYASSILPNTCLRAARACIEVPGRLAFRRRLSKIPGRRLIYIPALNYGNIGKPRTLGLIHGGRVKLVHLQNRYPEETEDFNLMYLVSSALPKFAVDLVHWAKNRGVKLVWNQNGVGYPAWAGSSYDQINAPMRSLLTMADFVVYQSQFCKASSDRFLGTAISNTEILYNPVDTTVFKPGIPPPDQTVWRLLAAGTHLDELRIRRAVEALHCLTEEGHKIELTLAGQFKWDGANAYMRSLTNATSPGAAIRVLPAFSQAEAVRLLQQSHILLHLKYNDPCPTMAIEAMACGVPVIGSASGGMMELVGTEGVLLPVPQGWDIAHVPAAADIAKSVIDIMGDWTERSLMARLRAVKLFEKTHWLNRHGAIFENLLKV